MLFGSWQCFLFWRCTDSSGPCCFDGSRVDSDYCCERPCLFERVFLYRAASFVGSLSWTMYLCLGLGCQTLSPVASSIDRWPIVADGCCCFGERVTWGAKTGGVVECRRHHPSAAVLGRIDFVVVAERIVVGGIVVGNCVVLVVVVFYWIEDFFETHCWTRAKSYSCHRSCRAVDWVECVVGLV